MWGGKTNTELTRAVTGLPLCVPSEAPKVAYGWWFKDIMAKVPNGILLVFASVEIFDLSQTESKYYFNHISFVQTSSQLHPSLFSAEPFLSNPTFITLLRIYLLPEIATIFLT